MYTDDMDGLGKSKWKKKFSPKKMLKPKMAFKVLGAPLMMPFAPAMTMKKKKGKKKNRVAPAVPPQASQLPTDGRMTIMPVPGTQYGPGTGFNSEALEYEDSPVQRPMPMPAPYIEPRPEPGARNIPQDFYSPAEGDFFPTELDYDYQPAYSDVDNAPMLTPYESAAASTFGNEEDFVDTRDAWESESGFLNGLGQEAGSTGGWFGDFVPQAVKAALEIAAARRAAKAARTPAPIFPTGTVYRPSGFDGFNLNTALMFGALGLGGFLLFKTMTKKRGR